MSEAGLELKYIKEAFEKSLVVPLGPNVNIWKSSLTKTCHAYNIHDNTKKQPGEAVTEYMCSKCILTCLNKGQK